MPGPSQAMDAFTQIAAPCKDELSPPPIPPPRKPWSCAECSRMSTPAKRRGPKGPATLCNACGIAFRKKLKNDIVAASAAVPPTPIPPHRKPNYKNTRPPKKKAKKRKGDEKSPRSKRERLAVDQFESVLSNAFLASPAAVPRPISAPVVTARSQLVRTPRTGPRMATRVGVPVTSSAPLVVAPSADSNVPSSPTSASFTVASLAASCTLGVATPASVSIVPGTAIQYAAPGSSPVYIHRPVAEKPVAPERGRDLPSETPPDPITTLLRPSSLIEESNADGILATLDKSHVTMNARSAESANKTDTPSFRDEVLAPCDRTATTSTPVEVLSMLDGTTGHSEIWPRTSLAVEGPCGEEGSMAALTGLTNAPETSLRDASGSSVAAGIDISDASANPPEPATGHPSLTVPPDVMQRDEEARYIKILQGLDIMNAQISQRIFSIDDRIAGFAKRHEELTTARNEINFLISQLISMKEVARKSQYLVLEEMFEEITRTNCLLQDLLCPTM